MVHLQPHLVHLRLSRRGRTQKDGQLPAGDGHLPHQGPLHNIGLSEHHPSQQAQHSLNDFLFQDTVYEYYVDTKKQTWVSVEEKLPKGWRYNAT